MPYTLLVPGQLTIGDPVHISLKISGKNRSKKPLVVKNDVYEISAEPADVIFDHTEDTVPENAIGEVELSYIIQEGFPSCGTYMIRINKKGDPLVLCEDSVEVLMPGETKQDDSNDSDDAEEPRIPPPSDPRAEVPPTSLVTPLPPPAHRSSSTPPRRRPARRERPVETPTPAKEEDSFWNGLVKFLKYLCVFAAIILVLTLAAAGPIWLFRYVSGNGASSSHTMENLVRPPATQTHTHP